MQTAAMTGAALAAAALAAVLLPSRALAPGAPPPSPRLPMEIRLETPLGTVPKPVEFRWLSPFDADRFLVEVFDRTGKVVWSSSTAGDRAVPAYLDQARMSGGRGYTWRVTAITKSGRMIAQSIVQPFAVAAR